MSLRRRREVRGSVPIELCLGVGVLLLPTVLLVLTLPTWVQRQSLARLVAQEAARTLAASRTWPDGVADATALARTIAANHGLGPGDLRLRLDGRLERGATVSATVTVRVPASRVPGWDPVGDFAMTEAHREVVDPYRSLG
ncbi:MAG: hypothetical protein KY434_02880 [Actinobacteria bacterium]|nr:hypothetical protein [Actinomycetota bacterium]